MCLSRKYPSVGQPEIQHVLTTHIDKGHVHNHLIFCAVNFLDYHKYNSNKKTYYGIRNISDRLCRDNGLSIVKPGKEIEYTAGDGQRRTRPAREQGRSYAEYAADKAGGSWKAKLKAAIDTVIPQSSDFEDFLRRMEAAGYEVRRRGDTISFRAPGQERYTRLRENTLGRDYTAERITQRIQDKKRRVFAPKLPDAVKLQAEYSRLEAEKQKLSCTSAWWTAMPAWSACPLRITTRRAISSTL